MKKFRMLYETERVYGHEISKFGNEVKIVRETQWYAYGHKLTDPIVGFRVWLKERPGDKYTAFENHGGNLASAYRTFKNLVNLNHM